MGVAVFSYGGYYVRGSLGSAEGAGREGHRNPGGLAATMKFKQKLHGSYMGVTRIRVCFNEYKM